MDETVRECLKEILGSVLDEGKDFDWICNAILSSLCMHVRMKNHDAFVRMPLTLAEPSFVFDLRNGMAVRSLHRISFLSRMNCVIEEAMDRVIADLGYEEMGKRGYYSSSNDYSSLDLDLKARHVSTEELSHALGIKLLSSNAGNNRFKTFASVSLQTCAPWWDRSCDLGLLIGTFIHGLGNYEAIRNDEELPFINRTHHHAGRNRSATEAFRRFEAAAEAAKQIFDTALVTMKRKFQQQTHAAVAMVFAAAKEAEGKESSIDPKAAYNAQTQKLDDDDMITLPRLKASTTEAFRSRLQNEPNASKGCALPLPDSNHLDCLLMHIVNNIEDNIDQVESKVKVTGLDKTGKKAPNGATTNSDIVSKNKDVFRQVVLSLQLPPGSPKEMHSKSGRVFFSSGLCGASNRYHDDAADYFLGAASSELASIAIGADASRYQRGPGVPLIVTRFALGAIIQADDSVVTQVATEEIETCKTSSDDASANNVVKKEESPNSPIKPDMTASSILDAEEKSQVDKNPAWRLMSNDVSLRAALCVFLLHYGCPLSTETESYRQVSPDLMHEIRCLGLFTTDEKVDFFTMNDIVSCASKFSTTVDLSDGGIAEDYFQTVLLPHCLRLCTMLSWDQRQSASIEGINDIYASRLERESLSPLPDPYLPFEDHSEEAMAVGYSILRRTRLMRSIRFLVGGGITCNELSSFLRGPIMRKHMMGVPVWWCPWIHDLGILLHASVHGLISAFTEFRVSQQSSIEQHIRDVFILGSDGKKPALPRSFLDNATNKDLDAWVYTHLLQFPCPNTIEHRLAVICSELTKNTTSQYDNVPMFDEGGWPMIEDARVHDFGGTCKTTNVSVVCLLRDVEE